MLLCFLLVCSMCVNTSLRKKQLCSYAFRRLIVLGFNDKSTLVDHFVSSPREREKRDRRDIRGNEREGKGRKRNMNERLSLAEL